MASCSTIFVCLLLAVPLCQSQFETGDDHEFLAYNNPSTTTFIKHLMKSSGPTYANRSVCRWTLKAADKDDLVQLSFPEFNTKLASNDNTEDCVVIYDGDSTQDTMLADVCDTNPGEYTSTGRYMLVVYRRGDGGGSRSFVLEFKSVDVLKTSKILRIAAGVGPVLAALVMSLLVVRYTSCCSRFFVKQTDKDGSTMEEATYQLTSGDMVCQVTISDDNVIHSNVNKTVIAPTAEDDFK